jgi:peptidoglycan endopeptidase LytE
LILLKGENVLKIKKGAFMMGRWTLWRVGVVVLSLLFAFAHQGLAEERYTVKPGDSLYKVAKSFNVSIETLRKVNSLEGDAIKSGQVLLIPTQGPKQKRTTVKKESLKTGSYVVKKGDNLFSISKRVGVSADEIRRMNQLHSATLKIGQVLTFPKTGMGEEYEEQGGSEESAIEPLAEMKNDQQESVEPPGKWSNPEERNLFVRVAKTFLGAPYRLGGSTLKGLDCSAFVKKIYEIFDIHLPRTCREQFHFGKKVEKNELEEGDLVFFKTRGPNNGHVGIYIGNNEFVHASNHNKEVKVDNLDMPYFNKHFLKGVRIKELEKET